MSDQRIMYICSDCSDNNPESCGRFDRNDLRVLPSGKWLCDECFDETTSGDRGETDEDENKRWCDFPAPPEYGPLSRPQGNTP